MEGSRSSKGAEDCAFATHEPTNRAVQSETRTRILRSECVRGMCMGSPVCEAWCDQKRVDSTPAVFCGLERKHLQQISGRTSPAALSLYEEANRAVIFSSGICRRP